MRVATVVAFMFLGIGVAFAQNPGLSVPQMNAIDELARSKGVDVPTGYMEGYVKGTPLRREEVEIFLEILKDNPKPPALLVLGAITTTAEGTAPHTFWSAPGADPPCGTIVNGAVVPPGYSTCIRPCKDIPLGKQVKATRLYQFDRTGRHTCSNGGDCEWSRWWNSPEVYQHPSAQTVCGNFKNWSSDRDRRAVMEIDYE